MVPSNEDRPNFASLHGFEFNKALALFLRKCGWSAHLQPREYSVLQEKFTIMPALGGMFYAFEKGKNLSNGGIVLLTIKDSRAMGTYRVEASPNGKDFFMKLLR
jgi:hypothetical protein